MTMRIKSIDELGAGVRAANGRPSRANTPAPTASTTDKPRKYRNEPCTVDGIAFDSKKEATRYQQLKLMVRAGQIEALELQPEYALACGGTPIKILNKNNVGRRSTYRADFRYFDKAAGCEVVEDVKGMDTAVSRLKRAIVEAEHGVRVKLT